MSIVGRDLDVSERKVALQWSNQFGGGSLAVSGGVVIQTGTTLWMFSVPFPCTVQSGVVTNMGVSGAPQIALNVQRFVGGATNFPIGISGMVLTAFGTSGPQGLSGLGPVGHTLMNLLPGDMVNCVTSVANTAISNLIIELIVVKTQDIVAYNRVST